MANISLVTYAGQTVTPLDDALVYETAINKSGMIYGGVVTIKNANNLHISGGHGMVCGRKFTIFDSDIQVALSSSGTLLGRLYVQLDLSNIGTPIQLLVETGASLTPVQQDQNVNIQNGVYEFNLATFSVDTSTISNLVNVAPSAEPSTGAGSIITVTTAEASLKGKMCTLTDGVNTLNANFDNTGTVVFYGVQMVGTVIVNATDGTYYASSQITITYFGKYSTALAFWGATVNLTTSTADFYGQTIEVTQDGIAVGSTAFDGAGSATYIAPAAGTYVFTVTYGGNDYSATVVVTAETTYTAVINNGFVLADWLSAGGVTGTYADLAAVLADEEAVRQLMTIHAAVDYLASFESTDASVVSILNNDYAAKWISLTDYAMDALEAAYGTLMASIGKYGYGEWGLVGKVPKMTSNTAPSGEALGSSEYSSAYPYWHAFDGTTNIDGVGDCYYNEDLRYGRDCWLQYKFTNPVCAKKFKFTNRAHGSGNIYSVPTAFKIQGSNDGTTFTDIGSFTNNNVTAGASWEKTLNNNTAYLYYRMTVTATSGVEGGTAANQAFACSGLQFYAWEPLGNVPVMTSASAPYGEVTVSSIYSSEFQGYLAFNGSLSGYGWIGGASDTTPYIIYSATNPFTAKKARMYMKWRTFSQINALTVTIEGSNTGNSDDWHSLGTHTFSGDASQSYEEWVEVALTNNTPYLKHRAIFNKSMRPASLDSVQIMALQFYGRTLRVSVPKMTSNTAPYGEAFSNGNYSSSQLPYMAFDKNTDNWWESTSSASQTVNGMVGYTFNEPMCIKQFMFNYYYLSGYGAAGSFRIEASNDGFVNDTNILYSGTIGGVATGYHIVSDNLDNDVLYTSYRLYVEKATHASGSNYFAAIVEMDFYGLDYSEREWDTEHPRHYIYDHGVELETLTAYTESANAEKKPSELKFALTGTANSIAEFYAGTIDFTDYSLMRAAAGDTIIDLLIMRIATATPYTASMHNNSSNYVATVTVNASDGSLPENLSLGLSSVSGTYNAVIYVAVGSASGSYRTGTIKELWLE